MAWKLKRYPLDTKKVIRLKFQVGNQVDNFLC